MDIEKMYNDTEQKMKQLTNLEENTFMKQIFKEDKLYYAQLIKVIQLYPSSKMTESGIIYTTKLGVLNGHTKNIQTINSTIEDRIKRFENSLKDSDREIKNLREMLSNLEKSNGNLEELDLTSRRLLNDYINIYAIQRWMLWIKVMVVGFLSYMLFSDAMKHRELIIYVILWGVCIILLYVISYFRYKWSTNISLPTSATSAPMDPLTCPGNVTMKCSDTIYGCCPDGITVSDKNKLNCGCAKSTYGCCPDGSNKNEDGSCLPNTKTTNPLPCNRSQYGCCPDNTTLSNATGSNCGNSGSKPPLCSRTQYGCCPDGNTISNVDRSNCVGSCARSEFGCCPNGVTISNKDRSNCIVPICTSTKYGCCPNGNPRNKIGSNC